MFHVSSFFVCLRLVLLTIHSSCNLSFGSLCCGLALFLHVFIRSKSEGSQFSLNIVNLHADIEIESCEAEKSILKRRLSDSALEVEKWVRVSHQKCSRKTQRNVPSGQLIQVISAFVETKMLHLIQQ